jgi:hypothetical protein
VTERNGILGEMEPLLIRKLKEKGTHSRWYFLIFVIGYVLWFLFTETIGHEFYREITESLFPNGHPMLHFSVSLLRWVTDNPLLFLLCIAVAYILYVLWSNRPVIEIVNPWDADSVTFHQYVSGYVNGLNLPLAGCGKSNWAA